VGADRRRFSRARAHSGADRSASSLARLLLDCLELLDVEDATVVANDTAGGLLLLSLATGHPALGRVGSLVLTNCDNYDQFPPDALRKGAALCRTLPRLARALLRLQLRPSIGRRKIVSGVAASGLDHERAESFFGPAQRDQRVVGDLVAALAGLRPQLLIDAAEAIPRFDRPVLLIWGESCNFFPITDAQRLASEFPRPTLVSVPEAKTWVPIDNPAAVADAIVKFVPTPAP
jgi:pimeloyl-ACP methyl ester carboxylesterase